jgi:predicted ATPase
VDPLAVFKEWLGRMLILRPIPAMIEGESKAETLQPNPEVTDFAAWLTGVLAHAPSAYGRMEQYLKQVMPDFRDLRNPVVGKDSHSLEVHFAKDQGSLRLAFEDLSDGEKCFMICAVLLAANETSDSLLCFWDEPDNYLAISEVSHFVVALRKAFQSGGQLIATSHNAEAIRSFGDENTFLLYRNTHMEPAIIRPLTEIDIGPDLVGALIRDDVEP